MIYSTCRSYLGKGTYMKKTIIIILITLLLTSCHQDSWEIETKETGYTITSLDALNKLNNDTVNHLLFSVQSENTLNIDYINHSYVHLPLTAAQANHVHYTSDIAYTNFKNFYEFNLSSFSLTEAENLLITHPQLIEYIKTENGLYYIIKEDERYILYYETGNEVKKVIDFFSYHDFYHQDGHIYLEYQKYNQSSYTLSEVTQGNQIQLNTIDNDIKEGEVLSYLKEFHLNQPFYAVYEIILGEEGFEVLTSNHSTFYIEPTLFFQPLQDYIITQKQTSERMLTKIITLDDEKEYDIDISERIYAEIFLGDNTFLNKEAITYDEYSYSIIEINDFLITKTLLPFQEFAYFFKINDHQLIACITDDINTAEYYLITLE